ncbi:MAG: hypothetical protein II381_05895 [Victivallales bacterium]|nr:hypothetical protein [Victivallales bacterium]
MDKFKVNFTEEQLKRGEELLPQARLLMGAPDRLTAEVHDGEQLCTVSLTVKDRRLVPECDCSADGVCPHLWTALKLAEQSGDLQFALKHNVSMRFPTTTSAPTDNNELQYQPEKTRPAIRVEDEDQRGPQNYYSRPIKILLDTPNIATQIIFVLPIELQPLKRDAIRFDVYWRQTARPGEKPLPAKPLLIDESSVIDSRPLAILLQCSIPRDKSLPPNVYQLPISFCQRFFEMMDGRNLLRWTSSAEQPRKYMRQLSIFHIQSLSMLIFCHRAISPSNQSLDFQIYLKTNNLPSFHHRSFSPRTVCSVVISTMRRRRPSN